MKQHGNTTCLQSKPAKPSALHPIAVALPLLLVLAPVGPVAGALSLGGPEAKIIQKVIEGKSPQGALAPPLAPQLSPSHSLTVRLDVTHEVQEIADGTTMNLWKFGGSVPGPTLRVRQGDTIHFVMANRSLETVSLSPPMPHSVDFHAAMVNPQDKYRIVAPGQSIEFEFVANYPGVFMYHCGTPMILQHMALGMYGAVIVEPSDGYPTKVDREYVIVQSEFYPTKSKNAQGVAELDMTALMDKKPTIVAFNGKAQRHISEPLKAKAKERVRLYVLNAGPNGTSSFHVVGTIFDKVWLDGNPKNELQGMQTVLLGASNAAIVEFVIPEKGKYVLVDHEFADVDAGAVGHIDATDAR